MQHHLNIFQKFKRLFASSLVSQLVLLMMLPVLTRFYDVEAFGYFGLFGAVSAIFIAISSFRYEMAIVMPKSIVTSIILYRISTSIQLIFSMFVTVVLLLLASFSIFDLTVEFGVLIGLQTLTGSLFSSNSYLLQKHDFYTQVAGYEIGRSFLIVAIQCVSAFLPVEHGLIYGFVLGTLCAMLLQMITVRRLVAGVRMKHFRFFLRRFRRFPYYSFPAALMNVLGANLPLMIVTQLFGLGPAGVFTIVQRIVAAPVKLVATNINRVVYHEVATLVMNKKPVGHIIARMTKVFFVVALGMTLIAGMATHWDFFHWFLGAKWEMIDRYVVYMLPLVFTRLVSASIARFAMFERQDIGLIYQFAFLFFSTIPLMVVDGMRGGFDDALLAYSLMLSLVFSIQVITVFRLARQYDHRLKGTS